MDPRKRLPSVTLASPLGHPIPIAWVTQIGRGSQNCKDCSAALTMPDFQRPTVLHPVEGKKNSSIKVFTNQIRNSTCTNFLPRSVPKWEDCSKKDFERLSSQTWRIQKLRKIMAA